MSLYYPNWQSQLSDREKKKGYHFSRVILALCLGFILGIASMAFISPFTNQESFESGVSYGIEYSLAVITNSSIQCNQIPINYSGYVYTLYPLECLESNQGGRE